MDWKIARNCGAFSAMEDPFVKISLKSEFIHDT